MIASVVKVNVPEWAPISGRPVRLFPLISSITNAAIVVSPILSAGLLVCNLKSTLVAAPVPSTKFGLIKPDELSCINKLLVGAALLNEFKSA